MSAMHKMYDDNVNDVIKRLAERSLEEDEERYVDQREEQGANIFNPSGKTSGRSDFMVKNTRYFDDMLACPIKEEDEKAAEAVKLMGQSLEDSRPAEVQEEEGGAFVGMLGFLCERRLKKQEDDGTDADKFALRRRLQQEYDAFVAQPMPEALNVDKRVDNDVTQLFFKPLDKFSAVQHGKRVNSARQNTETRCMAGVMPGTRREFTWRPAVRYPVRFMTPHQIEHFETKIAALEACLKFPKPNPSDALGTPAVSDYDLNNMYEVFHYRLANLTAIHAKSSALILEQISWSQQDKMELMLQLAEAEFIRLCIVRELRHYDE